MQGVIFVRFFMPKIKFPELREITSQFPNIVNAISKVNYLDYLSKHTELKPPIFLTDDDGQIVPCDSSFLTADVIWDNIQDHCFVISEKFKDKCSFNEYDYLNDFKRIQNNNSKRLYHSKKIVEFLLYADCVFLTLTFNDKTLGSTSQNTRRRYVRDYLNSIGAYYLANIDYGKKNDREHYHAIVKATDIDYSGWHKYGAVKGKRIVVKDSAKLTRYILKLSKHSIKNTTKGFRVITNVKRCDKLF